MTGDEKRMRTISCMPPSVKKHASHPSTEVDKPPRRAPKVKNPPQKPSAYGPQASDHDHLPLRREKCDVSPSAFFGEKGKDFCKMRPFACRNAYPGSTPMESARRRGGDGGFVPMVSHVIKGLSGGPQGRGEEGSEARPPRPPMDIPPHILIFA